MSRHVAVVPVKLRSERVENKNFKQFAGGLSLIEFKLCHLIKAGCFDDIYISSNAGEAQRLSEKHGLKYVLRDDFYCSNDVSWSDVIHHVVDSLPEGDDAHVSWCHTTSPLFTRYHACYSKYLEVAGDGCEYDGLTTVTKFNEFLVNGKSRPVNYNWGIWHDYSQHLEPLYLVTGALFLAQKKTYLKNRYVMSKKPFLFECSKSESVDVDTPYDFKLAQLIYENREKLES